MMNAATCLFLVGAMLALDSHADSHLEPVDDPAELAAVGLPPDAVDTLRLVADANAPDAPRGGGNFHAVTGDDFHMTSTDRQYQTDGNSYLYCNAGETGRIASAVIEVPAGRRIIYLDMWGKDDSAGDVVSATLFATCHPTVGPGAPGNLILATVTSAGQSGAFFADEVVPEYRADPDHCSYSINLLLGTDGLCEGDALLLSKVRVVWN